MTDFDHALQDAWRRADTKRAWIKVVLSATIQFKARHRRLLNEVTKIVELVMSRDILLMNNIIPFLDLPLHMFDGEEYGDDDYDEGYSGDSNSSSYDSFSLSEEDNQQEVEEGSSDEQKGEEDTEKGKKRRKVLP